MTRASDQALVDAWSAYQPDETDEEQRWWCDNPPDKVCAAFMRLDVIATQGFESEEDEELLTRSVSLIQMTRQWGEIYNTNFMTSLIGQIATGIIFKYFKMIYKV